jgi:hypothetical protein
MKDCRLQQMSTVTLIKEMEIKSFVSNHTQYSFFTFAILFHFSDVFDVSYTSGFENNDVNLCLCSISRRGIYYGVRTEDREEATSDLLKYMGREPKYKKANGRNPSRLFTGLRLGKRSRTSATMMLKTAVVKK